MRRRKGSLFSFLRGAGSTLDLMPARRHFSTSLGYDVTYKVASKEGGQVADGEALASDWEKVGGDIRRSVAAFDKEPPDEMPHE